MAAELDEGNIKQGLWLKAETQSAGDKDKARLLYIQWRVEQLSAEAKSEACSKTPKSDLTIDQKVSKLPTIERSSMAGGEKPATSNSSYENTNQRYTTVGGWLLLLCISMTICRPFGMVAFIADPLDETRLTMEVFAEHARISDIPMEFDEARRVAKEVIDDLKSNPEAQAFLAYEKLSRFIQGTIALLSFTCGCGLWARQAWALKWIKIPLWASLGIVFLDLIATRRLTSGLAEETFPYPFTDGQILGHVVGSILWTGIWLAYLKKSKRVRQTQWISNNTDPEKNDFDPYQALNSLVQYGCSWSEENHFFGGGAKWVISTPYATVKLRTSSELEKWIKANRSKLAAGVEENEARRLDTIQKSGNILNTYGPLLTSKEISDCLSYLQSPHDKYTAYLNEQNWEVYLNRNFYCRVSPRDFVKFVKDEMKKKGIDLPQ